jgi:hypothetical protein
MSKVITQAKAVEMMNTEAVHAPYRRLSISGCSALNTWLDATSNKKISRDGRQSWHQDAEQSANNTAIGDDITLEMCGRYTKSGNPEVLGFALDHFEWHVFDDAVSSYAESLKDLDARMSA